MVRVSALSPDSAEKPTTAMASSSSSSSSKANASAPAKRTKLAEDSTFTFGADAPDELVESQKWSRDAVAADFSPATSSVAFQWMDIDMYVGSPLKENPKRGAAVPGSREGKVPIIRLYGVSETGNSVLLHVHGFTPYFFADAPKGFDQDKCGEYRTLLNQAVKNGAPKGPNGYSDQVPHHVVSVAMEEKQSLLGYQGDALIQVLRIHTALPNFIPTARGILQKGFKPCQGMPEQQFMTYESNVPFVLRFMVDTDIVGSNWLELPVGAYSRRSPGEMTSHCQLELDVAFDSLVSHPTSVPRWLKIAPLRILSFDIECKGRKGYFPEAQQDPVIQIACYVTVQGASKPCVRTVMVLDTCLPIVGAEVLSFKKETDLLLRFSEFVRETDPDVLTGYNIQNFDVPYLMDRAKALKIQDEFSLLGRIKGSKSTMKTTTFSSSAYGTRDR
jgi:DNA polymerase delta subunit 1